MASSRLPDPPPSLSTLPLEILSMIGTGCESRDIAALRCVNRDLSSVYGEEFYKRNVKEHNTDLAVWAAANSQTKLLDRLFEMNKEITQRHWIVPSRYLHRCSDFLRRELSEGLDEHIVCTLSHVAAASGRNDVIRWLVSHGADLQQGIWRNGLSTPEFSTSDTLLSCACECTLQSLGSRFDCDPYPNWTPLHMAICHGQIRTVELLFAQGVTADMTWPPRSVGTTNRKEYISPLAVAASHGYADIVKLLLVREDCDPHNADHGVRNALFYAGFHSHHPAIITMLLAAGTDPLHKSAHQAEWLDEPFRKAMDEHRYSEALGMWKAGGERMVQEPGNWGWIKDKLKVLFGPPESYHCCSSPCLQGLDEDPYRQRPWYSGPYQIPHGRLQDEWREAREAIAVALLTATSPANIRVARTYRLNFKSSLSCSLWVALHSTVRSVERVLIGGADPNSWIYRNSKGGREVDTPLTYLATIPDNCINDRQDKIRLLLTYGARLDGPREPLRTIWMDPGLALDVKEQILKHSTQRNLPHAYAARMALELHLRGAWFEDFRCLASYFRTTTCSLAYQYVQMIFDDALTNDHAEPLRILTELGVISRAEVSRRVSARKLPKISIWLDSVEDDIECADGCGRWCYEVDMDDGLYEDWGFDFVGRG